MCLWDIAFCNCTCVVNNMYLVQGRRRFVKNSLCMFQFIETEISACAGTQRYFVETKNTSPRKFSPTNSKR